MQHIDRLLFMMFKHRVDSVSFCRNLWLKVAQNVTYSIWHWFVKEMTSHHCIFPIWAQSICSSWIRMRCEMVLPMAKLHVSFQFICDTFFLFIFLHFVVIYSHANEFPIISFRHFLAWSRGRHQTNQTSHYWYR